MDITKDQDEEMEQDWNENYKHIGRNKVMRELDNNLNKKRDYLANKSVNEVIKQVIDRRKESIENELKDKEIEVDWLVILKHMLFMIQGNIEDIVEKEQLRQFKEKYHHIKTLTSETQKNEIIQLKIKIYKELIDSLYIKNIRKIVDNTIKRIISTHEQIKSYDLQTPEQRVDKMKELDELIRLEKLEKLINKKVLERGDSFKQKKDDDDDEELTMPPLTPITGGKKRKNRKTKKTKKRKNNKRKTKRKIKK
jgi:hypothetical protein